jgi:hypothetical protein
MADGDRDHERPGAGEVARDAGAEIGTALARAAEAAGAAISRVGEIAGDALLGYFGSARRPGGTLVTEVLPEHAPLLPVEPGAKVHTRVKLDSDGGGESEPFTLSATDLVSDAGNRIPADAVVLPDQQRVIAANLSDTVPLSVEVPADAQPGVYRGELKADGAGVAPAELVIEVR